MEDGIGMTVQPQQLVLQLRDVRLERGTRTILDGISLDVAPRELVAIMGPSGSGKTTVLRAVAGLETFSDGRIVVGSVALESRGRTAAAALRGLRREVGMVFQFHCLFEHLSAIENVCLAPVHAHGIAIDEARRRARDLLMAFGVDHRAGAFPRELSGGEAQRVAIARALAVDPPLLLMDEPTASLDPARRTELGQLLRNLGAQGRTLMIATHDEDFAREFATRIVRIEEGRLSH
ncbi:MAG TPA: ATP-binding cassette domain-containing protein [Vicinamibacterales bacterium]